MHFDNFLERIEKECPGISQGLGASVSELVDNHIKPFSYNEHLAGLLLGRVQSGKTGQILGTISAAADEGFKLFILLTTDNVLLQKQTLSRAFRTLDTMNICGETDDDRFFQGNLRRPALLILKKNAHVLRTWQRHLGSAPKFRHEPMMIIDDEADAASLNTKVNSGDISTINSLLTAIKKSAPSSIYLQVTATPQAPLLQGELSGNKPSFIHVLEPGPGYLGGDFFYAENSLVQRHTSLTEAGTLLKRKDIPEGLRKAVLGFLISASERVINGPDKVASFLIHPSLRIADHEKTADKVQQYLDIIIRESETDSFECALRDVYADYKETYSDLPDLELVKKSLVQVASQAEIIVLNSNASKDIDYSVGINILIGGNSLGRGVTFAKLNTVYYCRSAKTPQADTVWQHSRVFGYDRDPRLCRLFMPVSLSNLFRELTEAQEALFVVLKERGLGGITLLSPPGTRPTRKAVVDQNSLIYLVGGVNYFPALPCSSHLRKLDGMLGDADAEHSITLDKAQEILKLTGVEDDEKEFLKKQISSIEALKAAGETACTLIVRTNRNVSAGTGSLLSPNDRARTMEIRGQTVLVMYRLNGLVEQGWAGDPLWAPNIKFPEGRCFYSIEG